MKIILLHRRNFFLSVLWLLFPLVGFSQPSAKPFYKTAMKAKAAGEYNLEVDALTKAIQLDSTETDYFKERIEAYEKLNKDAEAAADYVKLISLEKKAEYYLAAGNCYFRLKNYTEAKNMYSSAILIDKKYMEAYHRNAVAKMHLRDFPGAHADCITALQYDDDNFFSIYYKALVLDSSGNYNDATVTYAHAFDKIREEKPEKYGAKPDLKTWYTDAGTASRKAGKFGDALYYYNQVLELFGRSDAYVLYLRGITYFSKSDFQHSLDDFNKSIFIDPAKSEVFYERGLVHDKLRNFQNAVDDFTRALLISARDIRNFKARAQSFEGSNKFEDAIKDYESYLALDADNKDVTTLLADARKKLFERDREKISPVITLLTPVPEANTRVQVPEAKRIFSFRGIIEDANPIKSISVNGVAATYDNTRKNPVFTADANIQFADSVKIFAMDVYDNRSTVTYAVFRTESNPPVITLKTPFATPDNEIFLEGKKTSLYMEGTIKDENIIQSIIVEGVTASFELNNLNPAFSVTLNNMEAKDTITISATDKFNNIETVKYAIRRESAASAQANPMGRTWAVFIENSNYQNLQSLEGPAGDVTLMKSTLVNYRISKVIHKKDMTKSALDRFFSIELRDQVKNNQVQSLLVWFAGHGRYMNETGYWIPIDGLRDDESTLFNLNTLRAYMQSYTNVVHTLVVSDACESGPSFYLAMRDIPEDRRCDDWNNTKFHSAQVLTSSNAETAADESIFTKTFARSLTQNPESCIPIEKIAVKVTEAVKQNQKQYPKFGKIHGLIDENGTFFFIKK